VNVKNFIDGVEALAQSGGDETVPLLLLEVSQILLAGAQLGASSDVILPGNWEPEVGDDPDLDALRTGLAGRLSAVDEYAEVFDPYKDTSCLPFRISDDIAAVVADLIHGLKHYPAGRSRRCGGGSTPISTTGVPTAGPHCARCTPWSRTPAWTSPRRAPARDDRGSTRLVRLKSTVHPRPGEVRRGRGARRAEVRWFIGR
jgi:hypothetical protein